jgi:hypothetical protein
MVRAYLRDQEGSRRKQAKKAAPPDRKKRPPRARFLSTASVEVLLTRPDDGASVRVDLTPTGEVINYRLTGAAVRLPEREVPEGQSRRVAEEALKAWLGELMVERLGEPEVSRLEDAEFSGTRRYIWHAVARNRGEMEVVLKLDVLGERIIARECTPSFADSFLARAVTSRSGWSEVLMTLRVLLMALLALYACYRYARRAMEGEAPHGRVVALALIYVGFMLVSALTNPDSARGSLSAAQLRWLSIVSQVLVGALLGILLGVAYGAGEGEVREGWPGKLISLDALLTGRIWSANVGVAVLGGTACGLWLFGLSQSGLWAFGDGVADRVATLGFIYTRFPWLGLAGILPVGALALSVLDLMAPLTLLRRHVPGRALQTVLLVALALVLGPGEGEVAAWSTGYWIATDAIVLAVLGTFFLFDYLASVVALIALTLAMRMANVTALIPGRHDGLLMALLVAALLWLAAAVAAWRARRYQDAEVRPEHARNLAERLGLRAELNAAREAQQRLLPAHPPLVEGLSIAASCTPAREVSGDYHDFFPLSGGRLGIIVAEGGNDGLASALAIAMTKGFLMLESALGTPLEETLRRLRATLGGHLTRPSGETSLALFLVDPHSGLLRVARAGDFPRVLVLGRDGQVREPRLEGLDIARADVRLEPGDAVVVYTDGLARRMEQNATGSAEELLRRAATFGQAGSAAALHDTLLDIVLHAPGEENEDLDDDLTAIVLRWNGAEAGRLEEVA